MGSRGRWKQKTAIFVGTCTRAYLLIPNIFSGFGSYQRIFDFNSNGIRQIIIKTRRAAISIPGFGSLRVCARRNWVFKSDVQLQEIVRIGRDEATFLDGSLSPSSGFIKVCLFIYRLSLKLIPSTQLVFINSERGELHCKVKLAFSITEAQFCIRQLDSQKCKDAQTQMADSSVIKSASKSPRKRECSFSQSNRVLRSSSNTANAKERRVTRKIDFESHQ